MCLFSSIFEIIATPKSPFRASYMFMEYLQIDFIGSTFCSTLLLGLPFEVVCVRGGCGMCVFFFFFFWGGGCKLSQ